MKLGTVRVVAVLALAATVLGLTACGRKPRREPPAKRPQAASTTPVSRPVASTPAVYQSEVDEGVGAAVVILVDTSGSMAKAARRDRRPKHEVAREAVAEMLEATTRFAAEKPDFPVRVGVMHFSSSAWRDHPIQPYDREAVEGALARIPSPSGGTAIGDAMAAARPELYRSGMYRKYMIVVTDGENTTGADPAAVARQIHARSEGAVQLYFVAFDTDPEKFGFLSEVGGEVLAAGDAAELRSALREIYEGRILAEADYGETGLYDPRRNDGREGGRNQGEPR